MKTLLLISLLMSGNEKLTVKNKELRVQMVSDMSYMLVSDTTYKPLLDMFSAIKNVKRMYIEESGLYVFGKQDKDSIYIYVMRR